MFRQYFLPFRYIGFVIPLLVVIAAAVHGAVALFRFRLGPVTSRGREIGMWSRLTGALGALALLGCSIFIAIFIAVADIRDVLPGHQGVPADQVIWSIVGVVPASP